MINFSITNYKMFRDRTVISMEATKDKRLSDNAFSIEQLPKSKILKLITAYGANASGKTSVFNAMQLFTNFIRVSASHADGAPLNYTPFAFDESEKEPTSFEAEFISNGIRYQYGFGYDSERIVEEHLYKYPNGRKMIVFERDMDEYVFKSDSKFRAENARRVRKNCLYVSVCSQFNDEDCINVLKWATERLLILIDNDMSYALDVLTTFMDRDEKFRSMVHRAFRIADMGITDVHDRMKSVIGPSTVSGTVRIPIQDIWVKHEYNDRVKELPINMESSGTIRFLSVIGQVIFALRNGITLVIDEIDMSFHMDLCEWIAGLFMDPYENQRNAQLIINTHDALFLDQSMIRRDQIYIISKDWKIGSSDVKRLSDFNIRNDLDIRKAYLNGSFGGKPFIAPETLMEF